MMSAISMLIVLVIVVANLFVFITKGTFTFTSTQITSLAVGLGMILNEALLIFESQWWDDSTDDYEGDSED